MTTDSCLGSTTRALVNDCGKLPGLNNAPDKGVRLNLTRVFVPKVIHDLIAQTLQDRKRFVQQSILAIDKAIDRTNADEYCVSLNGRFFNFELEQRKRDNGSIFWAAVTGTVTATDSIHATRLTVEQATSVAHSVFAAPADADGDGEIVFGELLSCPAIFHVQRSDANRELHLLQNTQLIDDDLCGPPEIVRDVCEAIIEALDGSRGKQASRYVEFLREVCNQLTDEAMQAKQKVRQALSLHVLRDSENSKH